MSARAVALDLIQFDSGTQIRAAINEAVVAEYAELMQAGTRFPPVALYHDGSAYYMADGFHRALAGKRIGLAEISATVTPGTQQDALWFALGANKANGQRLTAADKRHAIVLALRALPDRSQTQIAEQVGCTVAYVTRVRSEVLGSIDLPDRVTGKDGKSYPASRPTPPVIEARRDERRDAVAALIKDGRSSQEIVGALRIRPSEVASVRRELGVGRDNTRDAVAQRKKDVRDMAERGFTTRQIAVAIGISEQRVSEIAKREGIVIHADRVVAKTHRHDANRIVERMALDAASLCADVELIDFDGLDPTRFPEWLDSFKVAREQLGGFIRRLMKEQQRHGEAA